MGGRTGWEVFNMAEFVYILTPIATCGALLYCASLQKTTVEAIAVLAILVGQIAWFYQNANACRKLASFILLT